MKARSELVGFGLRVTLIAWIGNMSYNLLRSHAKGIRDPSPANGPLYDSTEGHFVVTNIQAARQYLVV
eukprot:766762-Hanusia_phi.AAC.3